MTSCWAVLVRWQIVTSADVAAMIAAMKISDGQSMPSVSGTNNEAVHNFRQAITAAEIHAGYIARH